MATQNKSWFRSYVSKFLSVLALCAATSVAHAVIFFGEDVAAGGSLPVPNSAAAQTSFLSSLIGVGVEDFEGFNPGDVFPLIANFGDGNIATITGTTVVSSTGILAGPFAGRFPISGDQYLNLGTTDAGAFGLTFNGPQAAFGFFVTDQGDFAGQLTVSLDAGAAINIPHTVNAPDGGAMFWGIIDIANPFTTVAFGNSDPTLLDAFGFDDFTIGRLDQVRETPQQAAPEPGTLALLGAGILGLGIGKLRRR